MDKGKEIVNEPFWMHPNSEEEIMTNKKYYEIETIRDTILTNNRVHWNYGDIDPESLMDALEFYTPTADVREVVRGRWMQDCDYHFRCSACGERWIVSNGNPLDNANGWNFCPNCGADMREE